MGNSKVRKILVIKFRFHGDMLLTTPVISTLKANYPRAIIDVMGYENTVDVLASNDDVNKLIPVKNKKTGLFSKIALYLSLIRKLRTEKYDLVINLSEQWISGLMTVLIAPGHSVAFEYLSKKTKWWGRLYTELVKPEGIHVVERNLSILKPFNFPVTVTETKMGFSDSASQGLDSMLSHQLNKRDYVVIQPTARQKFKYWDNEKFAEVIDYIQNVKGYPVVLTSGPSADDLGYVNDIVNLCQTKPITTLAGKTSFDQLAALISGASLFIGLDSAPMHIAAAVQTPLICLFGATDYRAWHPWSKQYRLVWAGDYQPMPARKDIDRQFRYLACIPAQSVIDAVDHFLPSGEPV